MATEKAVRVIQRYLQDAIAAEKGFEAQLRAFAEEGSSEQVRRLFLQHADETRTQYERLTKRLEELGGEPSTAKSLLAQLVVFTPRIAQIGHDIVDRVTQDLIIAYSVENFEMAMYEALISAAEAAADQETALLAREIREEERSAATKVWQLIAPWAHTSFNKLAAVEPVTV
jgi:ferritin-like metal-binding protein YciE